MCSSPRTMRPSRGSASSCASTACSSGCTPAAAPRGGRMRSAAPSRGSRRALARAASARSSRRWSTGRSCCLRSGTSVRTRSSGAPRPSSTGCSSSLEMAATRRSASSRASRPCGTRASRSTRSPTAASTRSMPRPRVRQRGSWARSAAPRATGPRTATRPLRRAAGSSSTTTRTTPTATTRRWWPWRSRAPVARRTRPPPSVGCAGCLRCRTTTAAGPRSTARATDACSSTCPSPITTRCRIPRAPTSPAACSSALRGTASARITPPWRARSSSSARGRSLRAASTAAGA